MELDGEQHDQAETIQQNNHPKAKFVGTNTRGGEVYGYNYAYILLPHSHMQFNVGCVYRELFTEDFELNGYTPDIKCPDGTDAFAVAMTEIEKSKTITIADTRKIKDKACR